MTFILTREQQRLGAKRAGNAKKIKGSETKNLLGELWKREQEEKARKGLEAAPEIGSAHKTCQCHYEGEGKMRFFVISPLCKTHSPLERENLRFCQQPERASTHTKRKKFGKGE